METDDFIKTLMDMISNRRKMTSPLYQLILQGNATPRLLQNFVIHRFPVKNLWVRHLLSIGSRIDDYKQRRQLVENAYEEETGGHTGSDRHLGSFLTFGEYVGISRETVMSAPLMPETKALCEHNFRACNDTSVHFTEGVAAVLLLMEGQPPIVNKRGNSMEAVMRDHYRLPPKGYEYFTHHASSTADDHHVSSLEDTHTANVVSILRHYCTTDDLQQKAVRSLDRAIDLRHKHFDAIYERFYDSSEPVFRYDDSVKAGTGAYA